MDNESQERIDLAINAIMRFPRVMLREDRNFFSKLKQKSGFALGHHHVMIMQVLRDYGTMTSSELAAMVSISNAQMTHSTEKLTAMGLIKKQQDAVDHRKGNIQLTHKGKLAIQRIHEIVVDLLRERIEVLSNDELEKLTKAFDYIVEIYSR